jgi:hypothetical protein
MTDSPATKDAAAPYPAAEPPQGEHPDWVRDALRVHDQQAAHDEWAARDDRAAREELVLDRIDRVRQARPRVKEERITMSHGAGGKATQTLIEAIFLDTFRNPLLEPLEDAARLHVTGGRVALTTDSYVVSPLFFPGGDIGETWMAGPFRPPKSTKAISLPTPMNRVWLPATNDGRKEALLVRSTTTW